MWIVRHENRDNSANYRPLLQVERLMSDREIFGGAEDLSVFAIPGGQSLVKQRAFVR